MTTTTSSGDSEGNNSSKVWDLVLRTSLAIPGARVNREDFLRRELGKHFSAEQVKAAIESSPAAAGVPLVVADLIATSCINWHLAQVTSISFLAGLPGGWWIAGTVPTDLAQFYWHVLNVIQKLAYLYGWPELTDGNEVDDETLLRLTLFVGVMVGAKGANEAIITLSKSLTAQVIKRLPQQALTKIGIYNVAKQVAKWIGISMTKQTFARWVSKIIPILGGVISGTVTFLSFKPMAILLKNHLRSLPLATEPGKRENSASRIA